MVCDKKLLESPVYAAFKEWIDLLKGTIKFPLPNVRTEKASEIVIKRILQEKCPAGTRSISMFTKDNKTRTITITWGEYKLKEIYAHYGMNFIPFFTTIFSFENHVSLLFLSQISVT